MAISLKIMKEMRNTYLNEAVVEEQTDEAGARAIVTGYGTLHGLPDDAFRVGARVHVVADTKP